MTEQILDNKLLWKVRWEALAKAISTLHSSETVNISEKFLLNKLLAFSETLFHFLYEGLFNEAVDDLPFQRLMSEAVNNFMTLEFGGIAPNPENDSLITRNIQFVAEFGGALPADLDFSDTNFPKDNIINVLLRQTALDFICIQQASHFRQASTSSNPVSPMANALATRAMVPRPRVHWGGYSSEGGESTVVLSYPTDAVQIRLTPYCDAVMIGFPITAFCHRESDGPNERNRLSPDYLTLAHETGHMIFQYGQVLTVPDDGNEGAAEAEGEIRRRVVKVEGAEREVLPGEERQQIHKRIQDRRQINEDWASAWIEELFADAYCFLVEGPAFLVGFQELLAMGPVEADHEDGKHPPAKLRPFIQTLIMTKLVTAMGLRDDSFQDLAKALDSLWQAWVQENWDKGKRLPPILDQSFAVGRQEGMSGKELLSNPALEEAIDAIVQEIVEWQPATPDWLQNLDAITINAETPSETAEQLFQQYQSTAFTTLSNFNNLPPLLNADDNHEPPSMLLERVRSATTLDELVDLLIFNGWAYRGPVGGHGGM